MLVRVYVNTPRDRLTTMLYTIQLYTNVPKTGKRCIDFVRWSDYTESDYGDKISKPH